MGFFSSKKNEKCENVITVEGYTNDLLGVSSSGDIKQTRLFYLIPENIEEENQETIDLFIQSTNPYKSFPIFDQLIGKKIRISVDIIE